MTEKEMRVFHGPVNYGTQAGMLADGLRKHGIEAISAVYGDKFKRKTDIIIGEGFSHFYLLRKIQLWRFFFKTFFHYNVFHFYFGMSLLSKNRDLPLYRLFGKKVVMEYLGTDVDLWLGYNGVDWRGRPVDRVKLMKRVIKQSKQVDRQLVCTPHHYQFVDNSIILPLTIDIGEYSYSKRKPDYDNLTFMHCPTNRLGKRTKEIEDAIDQLKREGYHFNY